MTYLEISELNNQLVELMKPDSCLFLWVTNSMMMEAFYIMDDWNYDYKTMITWDKQRYGMGYWFRGQTEHCLFGVKCKIPALRSSYRNIIREGTRDHSEKPTAFYAMINDIFRDKRILELFATRQYPSERWTCIGKAMTGNDIVKDLEELNK